MGKLVAPASKPRFGRARPAVTRTVGVGHVVFDWAVQASEHTRRTRAVVVKLTGEVVFLTGDHGPNERPYRPVPFELPEGHPPRAAVRCSDESGRRAWRRDAPEAGPHALPFIRQAFRGGYDDELVPLPDLMFGRSRYPRPTPPPAEMVADTTAWFRARLVEYIDGGRR